MSIKKIKIKNFKCFGDEIFEIELNKGLNVLVGNNEAGKSTILEAIHLVLTGMYCGKPIRSELSQYLFNRMTIKKYIEAINSGNNVEPPYILIEVYFDGSIDSNFEGNGNTEKLNEVEGIKFEIKYVDKFNDLYQALIEQRNMYSLPIEYYDVYWTAFSRQAITVREIPIKSAMIDSSNYRYQNGSDIYISRIVKELLSPEEITSVAQAHRNIKNQFLEDESIKAINTKIATQSTITGRKVTLSVDLGTKTAWENTLVTQIDDIPFSYVGKGAQCILKTELALSNKRAANAQIILLEEPESHLSFAKLNHLISSIEKKYEDKQIIISTHSSFVANKLGLDKLILLSDSKVTRITSLESTDFFKKIAGYDTLRMLLCKKAILVEGDSDELVVQRAYMDANDGKLPIEDGIDVISVGVAFLRFLEIADILKLHVSVVTDNDGDIEKLERKYSKFLNDNKKDYINICYDKEVDTGSLKIKGKEFNYNTLEPKILKANNNDIEFFNRIFNKEYTDIDELHVFMKNNKTECALSIFESSESIKFPDYILEAIKDD